MIITKIHGGLGNQLFEYAAGRMLASKYKTILKLDISSLTKAETKRNFNLGIFNINADIATNDEVVVINKLDTSKKRKILWNMMFFLGIKKFYFFREKGMRYDPSIRKIPDNSYIHGHWQSEIYFKEIEDSIRKEFVVKTVQSGSNAVMANKIFNSNSVSIHIRRTDYVMNDSFKKIYDVCNLKYYDDAIRYVMKKVDNPTFFIFSDDINWVKNNMSFPKGVIFVDINDSNTCYEDLRLMSQCKHNIIANSTFSWWGAWLNTNQDKIIITPDKWFNLTEIDISDLLPTSWIRIKI